MKSLSRNILFIIFVIFSVVACSKKEDRKARGTVGKVGAAADGTTSAIAQQVAGTADDIVFESVEKLGSTIKTVVTLGGTRREFEFPHSEVTTTETKGAHVITASSMCAGTDCAYYYLMIEPRRNGSLPYQMAIMIDFENQERNLHKMQPGSSPLAFHTMIDQLVEAYENLFY